MKCKQIWALKLPLKWEIKLLNHQHSGTKQKNPKISYLTDHVLYLPSMCKGWSLATSMMMGSLFCGKFHIQVLQQEEKD